MDCSVYCGIQCLLPRWLSGKEFACQRRRCRFDPRAEMIPWRGKWQPAVVYLPGKSYEQRSLAGCSPWGRKELETTEQLNWTSIDFCISPILICILVFQLPHNKQLRKGITNCILPNIFKTFIWGRLAVFATNIYTGVNG